MTLTELRQFAIELRHNIENAEQVNLDTGREGAIAATIEMWKETLAQIETEIAARRRK